MGNSNELQRIRDSTIKSRDERMDVWKQYFVDVIRQARLTEPTIKDVLEADVVQLVELLNSSKITSLELVAIFGLRAITFGRDLGALTEDYFQYAKAKAKACDLQRNQSGKRNWTMNDQPYSEKYLPALFGVPISIKDNIEMAGTRSTVGCTVRALKIIQQDGPLVRCLKKSGMIPFIKTNIPQLGFTYETNNLLWGRCVNPWNRKKSSGGSSGGQAACIAARISPMGVGNDYGGSVRIPAHFCGISALLPSTNRVMIQGAITQYSLAFQGKDFIKNMNGPLGRSVDTLALWMLITTNEQNYEGYHDPYIKQIPFDTKLYQQVTTSKKPLRIGYFQHFDLIECTPACSRALKETITFLEGQGHELIPIQIPNETEVIFTMFAESMCEGGLRSFKDMLLGEPFAPEYKMMNLMGKLSGITLKSLKFLIKLFQPRVAMIMEAGKQLTTYQYLKKIGRGYRLRKQWIDYWRANKLDVVICPGFGSEATNHNTYDKITFTAAYTFVWNILAMTACSIPATVVRQDQQFYESKWQDEFTKGLRESVKDSQGLPVGIQVVGLPFSEEKVLGVSKKIEAYFQFNKKYPQNAFNDINYGLNQ